jgi:hypothetical protein
MVKPINNIIKAYKTHHRASIQAKSSINNFEFIENITGIKCILSYLNFATRFNYKHRQNGLKLHFSFLEECKLYKINTEYVAVKLKTTNTVSSKINDQFKSLAQRKGGNWKCEKDNEPNEQHSTEVVKMCLKFYSSLLDPCKYTSVKLADRAAGLKTDVRLNFPTANPVMVGSRKNNKEQCHRLWRVKL